MATASLIMNLAWPAPTDTHKRDGHSQPFRTAKSLTVQLQLRWFSCCWRDAVIPRYPAWLQPGCCPSSTGRSLTYKKNSNTNPSPILQLHAIFRPTQSSLEGWPGRSGKVRALASAFDRMGVVKQFLGFSASNRKEDAGMKSGRRCCTTGLGWGRLRTRTVPRLARGLPATAPGPGAFAAALDFGRNRSLSSEGDG